jgi:hypothetical protein
MEAESWAKPPSPGRPVNRSEGETSVNSITIARMVIHADHDHSWGVENAKHFSPLNFPPAAPKKDPARVFMVFR